GRAGGSAVDEFEAGFADFLDSQPDLGPKQHPSYVRVTDELPRTASFKVRTRDLTTLGVAPGDDRVFALPGGVHLSWLPREQVHTARGTQGPGNVILHGRCWRRSWPSCWVSPRPPRPPRPRHRGPMTGT